MGDLIIAAALIPCPSLDPVAVTATVQGSSSPPSHGVTAAAARILCSLPPPPIHRRIVPLLAPSASILYVSDGKLFPKRGKNNTETTTPTVFV